jgi:hypothetical protein
MKPKYLFRCALKKYQTSAQSDRKYDLTIQSYNKITNIKKKRKRKIIIKGLT